MSSKMSLKYSSIVANSICSRYILLLSLINGTAIVFQSCKGNVDDIFELFFFISLPISDCFTKLYFSLLCDTVYQLPVWSPALSSMGLHGPLSLAQIPFLHLKENSGLPMLPEFSEDLTFLISICCFWWIFNLLHSSPLRLFSLCTPSTPQNGMSSLCFILPQVPLT